MPATATPPSPDALLDLVQIASPCPASWAEMDGSDRVRSCRACRKNVYNLSALTAAESADLIAANEGHLCARLYRRRDGTVLTADCPEGVRRARRRRRRRAALAVVATALLSGTAWAASRAPLRWWAIEPPPSGPGVTLEDWADWFLVSLGLRQRPEPIMGAICLPRSPEGSLESADDY